MLSYKSFIDLLFILLLSSIVLLIQSVHVGSIDVAPAEVGFGGVSRVQANQVQVVVITKRGLKLEDREWADARKLAERIPPGDTVLLIGSHDGVRHHRVMRVWSQFQESGVDVKLGVEPDADADGAEEPSS